MKRPLNIKLWPDDPARTCSMADPCHLEAWAAGRWREESERSSSRQAPAQSRTPVKPRGALRVGRGQAMGRPAAEHHESPAREDPGVDRLGER